MAPALTEPQPSAPSAGLKPAHYKGPIHAYKEPASSGPRDFQKKVEEEGSENQPAATYPHYLPVWEDTVYPPLEPFTHYEHGKDADPSFKDLFGEGVTIDNLTAPIGAEVRGVQLSKLTDKGKDQLALFVAQRKVVAFRDQDLADIPIKDAVEFGGYFGRHHMHQTSGSPEGFPEVHLVHRGAEDTTGRDFFTTRTNSVAWHSDITFEEQPPGTTFLYILDGPTSGGDTLFANLAEAYNRLSPEFQKRLHGLNALHSGFEQIQTAVDKGGRARRQPVASVHPLVRTHPVTGEKALFVNPQFTRYIVNLKREESDYLLKFLYDHIALGQDFQARVRWQPKTVVVWDNRVTAHSAIYDWQDGQRRHLARLTPQAERPYETPFVEQTS
ncbi:TauD-domain-containing protein [Xylona heveae TC161]|uniref:TauD-domain-containing protein n=1 Tax=Xylona heveae (strain CBS 132557 / TC161) TaxID=1328760 RepID=A0A165FFM3_XYLHT|nr:TauD-domain-containing protein [Xylona heveae TC161]KZF20921.1 TauD-domain-containing protein [Xylona heveae TC161]